MSDSLESPEKSEKPKKELSSTYFVQDRKSERELLRVMLQDKMITDAMGGVLPEQDNPAQFRRMLDIGSGSGGWAIEVAKTYAEASVVGIDISSRMVEYARQQAEEQGVSERVEFHVMDALRLLEFPANTFDLVNLRFGISFMRTWDWPKLIQEMLRVARPGGTLRLTDNDIHHQSNSPALRQLQEIGVHTLFRSGNLFTEEGSGLIDHLAHLLTQHGCQQVQSKTYALEFRAGMEQTKLYYDDMAHAFQTTRPYIRKWGCEPPDYDDIYEKAIASIQQSDFHVIWHFLTAWGRKPGRAAH